MEIFHRNGRENPVCRLVFNTMGKFSTILQDIELYFSPRRGVCDFQQHATENGRRRTGNEYHLPG